MRNLILSALMIASTQASARTVHCFSNYFGANQFKIDLDATIAGDDKLKNVRVVDEGDGFVANMKSVKGFGGNHKKNGPYADYQDFEIINSDKEGKKYLESLYFLLPKKLTTVKANVTFDGYGSDPNTDNSGSDGYQRLICKIRN